MHTFTLQWSLCQIFPPDSWEIPGLLFLEYFIHQYPGTPDLCSLKAYQIRIGESQWTVGTAGQVFL